jgi:hypothetical protein
MAKKSLKKRIDDLVHALGAAKKPSPSDIRNELVPIGIEVEALENGQALAEKEAAIAALEAENENLKVELQTANTELETLRAEQKKQQEEKRDLPEDQFEILKWLPSQHGGERPDINFIAHAFGRPVDETGIRIYALRDAGLIAEASNQFDQTVWHRTIKGDKLVVSKRFASEKTDGKTYKHPDLPQAQHEILLWIAGIIGGALEDEIVVFANQSVAKIQYSLRCLKKAGMADDGSEEVIAAADLENGLKWKPTDKGYEYLDERDLL